MYEDAIERKGVVRNVEEIDEIYAGGETLDPDFYDEGENRYMKISITIECHSKSQDELDQIDENTREVISDLVNDWLMVRGDLGTELKKLNIEPDIYRWSSVKFVAV